MRYPSSRRNSGRPPTRNFLNVRYGEGMSDMAMHDMSNADWSLVGAGVFVALWTVMMAAMMLPGAAPMIMIFASAPAQRDRHRPVRTWIFVSGYILVWMAAGAAIYVLIQIARRSAHSLLRGRSSQWEICCAWLYADRSRTLSVHAAQAHMPQALPLASCLRGTTLA